jgi:hypothetical protein
MTTDALVERFGPAPGLPGVLDRDRVTIKTALNPCGDFSRSASKELRAMAKVKILQFADRRALIYCVEGSVGPGAGNRRDDVLLVQYFLREAFKSGFFKSEPFSGDLAVDGAAGPRTFAAILHFQKASQKLGVPISTDGRVDAPIGEQAAGSISNTAYTIVRLNQAFNKARPSDRGRVSVASDCPGELRALLKEPEFVA